MATQQTIYLGVDAELMDVEFDIADTTYNAETAFRARALRSSGRLARATSPISSPVTA